MDDAPRRELFDEELYLRTFPDVAQAVRDGLFSSGHHHWTLHGRFEIAAGQRESGPFVLAPIEKGAQNSAAGNDLVADLAAKERPLAVAKPDSTQKNGDSPESVKRTNERGRPGIAEASDAGEHDAQAQFHPALRYAFRAEELVKAGDIEGAAAAIAEAVGAARPSDTGILLFAGDIFSRVHFPPGPLVIKAAQAPLRDAEYDRLISIWTEHCRAGLSEADVESLFLAAKTHLSGGTPSGPLATNNAKLWPFILAAMTGSIRLPIAAQMRIFDHLQETISVESGDTIRSRVWPVLLPALHDYVGVVSVRAMQGGLEDLAALVTEFTALLFREFHEQAVAERLLEVASSLDPALRADPFYRSTYVQVLEGRSANYEIAAYLGSIDEPELTAPNLFLAAYRASTALTVSNPADFLPTLDWLCRLSGEVYEKDPNVVQQAAQLIQGELRRFTDAMIGRTQQRANRGDLSGGRRQRFEILEHGLAVLRSLEATQHLAATPAAVSDEQIRPARILVIGSRNLAQCWLYRVQQKVEFLRMAGYDAVPIDFGSVSLTEIYEQLCFASHAIIFRLPAFTDVLMLTIYAKRLGVKLFYDIDDLIFDDRHFPGPLESYSGLITRDTHTHLAMDNPFFQVAMSAAGDVIVSTQPLADLARELLGPSARVQVHRNMVGLELAATAKLPRLRKDDEKVRIFFGSGTLAHKAEFYESVIPAIARIMDKRPEVELHLVGAFVAPAELARFASRVRIEPAGKTYGDYVDLVREADINIAVMEDSIAVDCKSELKWFEAGIFGIPSVVSPSRNYADVLANGKDVIFARTTKEWHDELLRLVDKPALRKRIGAEAKRKIEQDYTWRSGVDSLSSVLGLGAPRAAAQHRRTRLLFVNVFFWPQSIGGATRILEDSVRYISEHYPDEFELYVLCADESPDPRRPYHIEQYWYGAAMVTRISVPRRPWSDHEDARVESFVRRFVREYQIDLAHVHCVQLLTAAALRALCDSGVPTVVTVHDAWWLSVSQFLFSPRGEVIAPGWAEWAASELVGADSEERAKLLARRLDLMALLGRASRVLAVSESFAEVYRAAGLATVGVNENGVTELPALPERRHRHDGAPIVIGFVGGMSAHKGYDLLREVVRETSLPHLEFLIVDHAMDFESSRRSRWGESLVRFVGRYPQTRVHELYAEMDILAAPSLWPESFGLVTREALLAGVPVIASDRGDVGRHVRPGIDGWIVDVTTPQALHDLLARLDRGEETVPVVSLELSFRRPSDQVEELVTLYVGGHEKLPTGGHESARSRPIRTAHRRIRKCPQAAMNLPRPT
ncbi:glycosyltransferase [Mycobacterium paraterrae]|uniref:Glycosyltransferase n=1 Tax=Mycobacterium paraterrae TaxID=577492 RepID=A0ABY3VHZ0_9MYCO|nr:glycosyltransferase [Mycobacterium paraterrae]UMB69027.1 glycosyltransferase [Mycobacterium paraterrae]